MSNPNNRKRPFNISLLIHQVDYLQSKRLSLALKPYGLTIYQTLSLIHVARHEVYESVNQRSIEQFTKLSNPGVSKLVNALVELGYLERTEDLSDRRNYILLTNQSRREEIEELRRIVLQVDAESTKLLTDEEKSTLIALLRKMRQ